MNIIDLTLDNFGNILKIDHKILNSYNGYDLDDFASSCAGGSIEGVESHATQASTDILYINKSKNDLYKIEGKDISQVIFNKVVREHLSEVELTEHYIDGIGSNSDKEKLEKGKKIKKKKTFSINMESKIKGTEFFLDILEDGRKYNDKGYILLINYTITESLIQKECIEDRIIFENKLSMITHQIKELKRSINEMLDKQSGFKVCDIKDLPKLIDKENGIL
ncbi:hypothetical protein [uncultured Clostridium sp.]|uniref:hypothetical protein n=1 Tax=uncultured Clostridium sp. TaxID=59620 RepID=UPI00260C51FE|nr:hypothetical protein [uncultured Clostridium sp.]